MTHDEFLQGLKGLSDKWCERHAIRALHHFLGGYFALNGLTDGYAALGVALKDVLAFAGTEITEEEKAELKRLLVYTQGIVYRE
jgi:hypothetical protein